PRSRCRAAAAASPTPARRSLRARSRLFPSQDVHADAGEPAARAGGERDIAVGHLGVTALAAQLPHRFDDQEDAAHAGVVRRETATVGVERPLAALLEVALGHERAA